MNKSYENEVILSNIRLNCNVETIVEPYESWDKSHEWCYFKIDKLPKWRFAISNYGEHKYVFGQEITTIDKFKHTRSAYCVDVGGWRYDSRCFTEVYEMINSIRKHPLMAFYYSQWEYKKYCDLGFFGLTKFYILGKVDHYRFKVKRNEIADGIRLFVKLVKLWAIKPSIYAFKIKDGWKGKRWVCSDRWNIELFISRRIGKVSDDSFDKYCEKCEQILGTEKVSYFIYKYNQ